MARRTRSHGKHSDLPPVFVDTIQEQGGQQDPNNLYVEEVPEHRLGKEPMVVDADGDANLGELTCHTERLEDVIRAVQTTVNQLNSSLFEPLNKEFNSFSLWQDQLNKPMALTFGETRRPRSKLMSLRSSLQVTDCISEG